ncbi:MAG: baseplate wedge protein 53 [Candidatus Izemoplasma sp.]
MANTYFHNFPKFTKGGITQVDLSPRVVHSKKIFDSNMLANYTMLEGETPQSLAQDFYGDPNLDWILFLANQVVDPLLDYPLDYIELKRLVDKKYTNPFDAHHWILDEIILLVDPVNENATIISNFQYEEALNEEKRIIKILRPEFVQVAISSYGDLI